MLDLYKKVTSEDKVAFLTAIVLGIIIHFVVLANDIHNPDAITIGGVHYFNSWEFSLGRWGLCLISTLKRGAMLPVINTSLSILCMALSAVFIIKILHIKKTINIMLISAILVAAPTFADTLIYNYCSDSYSIAMLLSVLAVYFVYKDKSLKKFLLASFCVVFAMGIYQSYIGVFITLCMIIPILNLLMNNKEIKDINKDIFRSVGMVALGLIIYYIITQITLKIYNIPLSSYGGANEIGILNMVRNLPKTLSEVYETFYSFFFTDSIVVNAHWKRKYINALLLILLTISYVIIIIKNKTYKKTIKLMELTIFSIILPIGINFIKVIAPARSINLLMCSSIYLVYILLIAIMEKLDTSWKEIIIKWIVIGLLTILTVTYALSDQYAYKVRKMIFDQTYCTTVNLIDRIRSQEGYQKNMKMCFAGTFNQDGSNMLKKLRKLAIGHCTELNETFDNYSTSRLSMKNFIAEYCGENIEWCTTEEYNRIINSSEFKDMDVYPKVNSIKLIDDIMVVKLNTNPPKP